MIRSFRRRRSLLGQQATNVTTSGFNGYTLLASDSNVAYNLIDTQRAVTTRWVGLMCSTAEVHFPPLLHTSCVG